MTIGVVRGTDTVLLKPYGYADIEYDVPTPDRAVYEIGSITKQFTAAGVLQLVDEGKIDLGSDLTTYLQDYPAQGRHITISQLLHHTSGIRGFSGMPAFRNTISPRKLPRDSLVALFSSVPLDFEPGTRMVYSNSGYFLLGLLIERVSGEPYDQYIQRHLFAPAGMQDSRYCSERAVYRRRAHGYDRDSTGLIRARFLDHTWPFSAGSICSTARDLVAWNAALHHGRILAPKAYRTMMAPGELNDGTKLRYGAGLAMADLHGHRAIYHSGLIYGFTSQLRYYPDDSLTVVVLMNTLDDASLQAIITQIADLVLGPTPPMPPRGAPEDTRPFTGHFKDLAPGVDFELTISSIPTELRVTFEGDSASALRWVGGTTFARDETFYTFVGSGDHFDELRVDNVFVYFILRRLPN